MDNDERPDGDSQQLDGAQTADAVDHRARIHRMPTRRGSERGHELGSIRRGATNVLVSGARPLCQ